jgi:hypothetical protein
MQQAKGYFGHNGHANHLQKAQRGRKSRSAACYTPPFPSILARWMGVYLLGLFLTLAGIGRALAQSEIVYYVTLTSDWTTITLRSEETWNVISYEILEGQTSNPRVVYSNKGINISKAPYDTTRVVVKIYARLNGLRARANSWVWYLIEKGDIGEVILDVRVPWRVPRYMELQIARFTNALNIPDNFSNGLTCYADDDAHLTGIATCTVQYRIWTNSDWTHLVLTGGQRFSNVRWTILQGADAPGLTISFTQDTLAIHKRQYDTTPVEVLFTADLQGLVYGEAVAYESRKGALGQTRIQVYGVPGPTGKRAEIAREVNSIGSGATNPYPFAVRALEHAEWQDIVGAFFYTWYGDASQGWRHWNEGGHSPPCTWAANYLPDIYPDRYDPAAELYSSTSPTVFRWQVEMMVRAGIELGLATWWGINSYTDRVFNTLLNHLVFQPCMPRIQWTVYLEPWGTRRTREEIYSALKYIVLRYGNSPYFARLYGAPLIFVYSVKRDEIDEFYAAVHQLWQEGIIVYLNVDSPHVQPGPGDRSILASPPLHSFPNAIFAFQACNIYDPIWRTIQATGGGSLTHSRSVSPGFWKYDESPRLDRDADMYQAAWDMFADISSRHSSTSDQYVQFLLITTWNEIHEGTQIEPAHQIIHDHSRGCFPDAGSYGTAYVDITANAVAQFKRGPDCEAHNGDVDNNGCVDDADLLAVLFAYGCTVGDLGRADVNCDGVVDDADLLIVLFNFGSGC